ncbi:MAG TPA: HAMP domain-containing protein [Candidatus Ventricola gallistercoris]|nr:HAMP domain-containing protein [Candidatus Ventricola gallistercoris]
MAFLLIIGLSFYLVAVSTINLVGDSLFADTIRQQMSSVSQLAVTLGERLNRETAEAFYQRLTQAARQIGGRLLVVDTDGKVIFDTFDERCGTLLALGEVHTVLRGEKDGDYGFHLQDGAGVQQAPSIFDRITGRDVSRVWVGCFTAPLEDGGEMQGVLIQLSSVQDTVDSLVSMRDRMIGVFLLALVVVLAMASVISRVVTKPVKELSAGIERMSKGDYEHRVHVPGHSEMAQLAAAFNQMSEQVRNLDEARNQFVSNASHELKTPLATIKILVESMMYQEDMDPQLRNEFLGDIDKEIDRLSSVVGDLLTLVHIDSHKLKLRREMMVFADTVRESVARLKPLAQTRDQEIKMQIADSCEMFADPGKLAQVCYNIIENAIKYTPNGGTVTVSLHKSGRDAVLDISDTGVGIPPEDLPHIFDRFYRVDKARSRDTGGTGLGLSIVKQIVRLHAGSVNVQSEVGKGTTFTVQLPVK